MIFEPKLGTEITKAVDVCLSFCRLMREEFELKFNGKLLKITPLSNRQDVLRAYWGA